MMQGGLLEVEADDELVAAVRRGDDGAFGELVARHRDWLTARCRRHLGGDAHAAEDVVQECLVALQRTLRTKDAPMRVRPWLSVVARNRCIDETRKLRAVPTSAIPETPVFDPEVGTEDEFLSRAWSALTGRHRAVLELRELGGLSYDEIAANLALTSGAVEGLLFRARSALRREYARAGGRVAAMAPIQEAVARATGGKGVVTGAIQHGALTAAPGIGDGVAAAPLVPAPSGAVARLVQELQVRLLTTPGIDGVLGGPGGGSGRLRGALAAVGLLLGGVATVATTVIDDVDLPAPPPVVVNVPEATVPPAPALPAASTPPTPSTPEAPAAPAPAPAPAPAVPETPSASTGDVPSTPAPSPSLPVLSGTVPAVVDGTVEVVDEVVEETLAGTGEVLGGLLGPGR